MGGPEKSPRCEGMRLPPAGGHGIPGSAALSPAALGPVARLLFSLPLLPAAAKPGARFDQHCHPVAQEVNDSGESQRRLEGGGVNCIRSPLHGLD